MASVVDAMQGVKDASERLRDDYLSGGQQECMLTIVRQNDKVSMCIHIHLWICFAFCVTMR